MWLQFNSHVKMGTPPPGVEYVRDGWKESLHEVWTRTTLLSRYVRFFTHMMCGACMCFVSLTPIFHRPDYTDGRVGQSLNALQETSHELHDRVYDRQQGYMGYKGGTRLEEPDWQWFYIIIFLTLLIFLVASFCRFLSSSDDNDDDDEDEKDK